MGPPRRPTLATIAERVGVTPMTVSNAYNRPDKVSAELRARILDTARELGYPGPDPVASSLRRGRTRSIGVVLGEELSYAFDDPSAVDFLGGVAEACVGAGSNLLLVATGGHHDGGVAAVQQAAVDAFILWATPEHHPLLSTVLARGLPVVIHGSPQVPGVPFVSIDNRASARAAAAHLLGTGRHRLGVVSFPFHPVRRDRLHVGLSTDDAVRNRVTGDRLTGYADAAGGAGLAWAGVPVFEVSVNDRDHGHAAGLALLDREPRPDAIVAMSDELALGVLRAARERGVPVPDRLAVAGCDDAPASRSAEPPLTTIRQSLRAQGRLCARIVLAPGAPAPGEQPWELVVRASSSVAVSSPS
jgi:DNA-binding LacI/PurR family transcriptional regulator